MTEPTTQRRALQRWSVFGGVALALVGTAVFARGIDRMEAALLAPIDGDAALALVLGLLLLAVGVSLATATRFGTPGVLAGLGVPALAFGLAAIATGLVGPAETVQPASLATSDAATTSASQAGEPLLLVSGIVASMVGLMLLFVFGFRAKGARR